MNERLTRVRCDEGEVAVWRSGRAGGPPVVLLHNGGADHRIWDAQVPALAERHDVLALDLLGFGDSAKPDVPYRLDLYCSMLEQVLARLGLDRPVLAGNCIGAATALEHAARHAGAVRALALFNVCGGRTMLRRSTGISFDASPWRRPFFLASARGINAVPFLQRRIVDTLFGRPARDLPIHAHVAAQQRTDWHPRSRWNLMRGLGSFNKYGEPYSRPDGLPPVLLAWGAANRVLSIECGRDLAAGLRPDRFVEVPGAGHLVMCEEPEKVNALLGDFLGAAGGTPPRFHLTASRRARKDTASPRG